MKRRKTKILFFSLLVLMFILAIWVWKKNVFSKEVLKLEILGPPEISVGEETEFVVKFKNTGKFRLEEPELIFEPPENSLEGEILAEKKILGPEKIGIAIYSGQEKSFPFKLRLFGKDGEIKVAKAFLSFRPKNLKSRYTVETSFSVKLKEIPLTFEFAMPSRVQTNKEFTFQINYFSHLDFPLTDLRIQIEYPSNFEFFNSRPKGIENTEWEVPILNKLEGGRIEISGKIFNENSNTQIFKARLGMIKEGKFILLKEIKKGLEIAKSAIFVRQEINENPHYSPLPGEFLHYTIYFKNIGEENFSNLFLIVKLEGELFDFRTLRSDAGECQAGSDSCVFDWRQIPKLSFLPPADEGKVDFWIKLKEKVTGIERPVLKTKVFIEQTKEEFVTKVSSKIEIVQKALYFDEIFGNSGPLPPVVGQSTTYTILWQIKNYYSDLKETKIKAKLPPNVSLTGKFFPQEFASKVSFDSNSREIIWNVGEIEKGRGENLPSLSLAFQVSLLPSFEQRGKSAQLISEVEISGEDTWTEKVLKATFPPLDTTLPDDPQVTLDQGIVQ